MILSLFVLYLINYSTVQGGKEKHTIGTFNWKMSVPWLLFRILPIHMCSAVTLDLCSR